MLMVIFNIDVKGKHWHSTYRSFSLKLGMIAWYDGDVLESGIPSDETGSAREGFNTRAVRKTRRRTSDMGREDRNLTATTVTEDCGLKI